MSAKVEWNLAALTKWEELTGKPYQQLQELTGSMSQASITDIANMLICGIYGARFPNADIEEIKKEVFSLRPDEMENFFSALQQEEAEQ